MDVSKRLEDLNIELGESPAKGGIYDPCRFFSDKLAYISGCGPQVNGVCAATGKVGKDLTLEEGQEAAKKAVLNMLAVINDKAGGLDKVKKIVKLLGFVASADGFYEQPQVIDAASQLLIDIFGQEAGCAARSAIGVNTLPSNIPVEIEALVELY